MNVTMRTQILVGTAAALAIVLVGTMVWFFFPKRAPDIARILPAEGTKVLISDMTANDAKVLSRILPSVVSLNLSEQPTTAVLVTREGKDVWLLLDQASIARPASHPILSELAASTGPRLSDDDAFRDVMRSRIAPHAWAFLRSEVIAQSLLDPFTLPGSAIAARVDTNGLSLVIAVKRTHNIPSLIFDKPNPMGPASVHFTASSVKNILQSLAHVLSAEDVQYGSVMLKSLATSMFGTDVSPAYDLLPLFGTNGSLSMADAGKSWVLQLPADDDTAQAFMEKLHRNALKQDDAISIDSHSFDNNLSMDIVEVDQRSLEEKHYEQDGWNVEERTASGSNGLYAATRGNRLIASNHKASFDRALKGVNTPIQEHVIAHITADTSALPAALLRFIPAIARSGEQSTSIDCFVSLERNLLIISIR